MEPKAVYLGAKFFKNDSMHSLFIRHLAMNFLNIHCHSDYAQFTGRKMEVPKDTEEQGFILHYSMALLLSGTEPIGNLPPTVRFILELSAWVAVTLRACTLILCLVITRLFGDIINSEGRWEEMNFRTISRCISEQSLLSLISKCQMKLLSVV